MPALLERSRPLAVLRAAISAGVAGHSGVVLIAGEAGVGKSTLVRAGLAGVPEPMQVLRGSCDDLIAANPLGPLREAVRGLPNAQPAGEVEEFLTGMLAELSADQPRLLLIEDLHWADDATLDVLAYLVRRIDQLRAVLVLTYRDDEVGPGHPVQRFLAAVPADHLDRIGLGALSAAAVVELSVGSGWDPAQLFAVTGGNPFYVTEVLAAPPDAPVPRNVAEAVLARLNQLDPATRAGVERLSVWPGELDFGLAEELFGSDLAALAVAEERGVLTASEHGLSFRHELARRAVESSLPRLRRRAYQAEVTHLLRSRSDHDLSRLVHHAIQCGDDQTVAEFAPIAGRQSAEAGAHRQALAFFAAALLRADLLTPEELAGVLDSYAWELYNAHRFEEAVGHAERAVATWRLLDRPREEGVTLSRLARHRFMLGDTDAALACATRAVELGGPELSSALVSLGALLALDVDATGAPEVLEEATSRAGAEGRTDVVALAVNYASIASPRLSPDERLDLLRRSIALARSAHDQEVEARGYTNLGELLYRYGRYPELAAELPGWLAFAREHGFWSHAFNLEVHAALLAVRRGEWSCAETELAALVERYDDPGMLVVYSLPPYARQLARRGDPAAGPLLARAWERARQQRMLIGLGYAGAALTEWGWLNGRPEVVEQVLAVWAPLADRPAAGPLWAEIRRYAQRAGVAVPSAAPSGTGDPWELGLAGDPCAAAAWARVGDPYEQALERLEATDPAEVEAAVDALADLGAHPAAAIGRSRLRELGVRARGPLASTRANPGRLTGRQLDIAQLLAEGRTNAEIAAALYLSVRTVDHHVSSILGKLGVASRREAAAVVRSWADPTYPAGG